jgi:hypothetical protein
MACSFDRSRHFARAGKARGWLALQAAEHDGIERGGDVRSEAARRYHLVVEDRMDGACRVLATEEALSRERLPQDDAHREDIATPVERAARELLRRHVGELPFDLRVLRFLPTAGRLRDAKVEDASNAVSADEDVLRRDVAMDQAERFAPLIGRLVCGVEPLECVADDGRHNRYRKADSGSWPAAQNARKGLTEHEFHDDEELSAVEDNVEHVDNVGVSNPREKPRFVQKHPDEAFVLRQMLVQPFDRDRAGETCSAHHPADVHGGHATARYLRVEHVSAELLRLRPH